MPTISDTVDEKGTRTVVQENVKTTEYYTVRKTSENSPAVFNYGRYSKRSEAFDVVAPEDKKLFGGLVNIICVKTVIIETSTTTESVV